MNKKSNKDKVIRHLRELWYDTRTTSIELFKVTIPAIVVTKILEELGLIGYLSQGLEPVMALMGLPGELGLVWATALLTSLYGAVAVFAALAPGLDLSAAQVTVLCSIMLIAHMLPVELSISRRAGAGVAAMAALRLIGALVYGIILNGICSYSGIWQESAHLFFKGDSTEKTLLEWSLTQIFNLGLIFFVIFCILSAMRLLAAVGFLRLLEKALKPVLPLFGMTHRAAPVTVVGMILGIGYGGALIIRETTTGEMDRREIFNSLALMALSHGLIEDTLLMMAIGGKLGGIFWGRLLFSLVVLFLLVRITDIMRSARAAKVN